MWEATTFTTRACISSSGALPKEDSAKRCGADTLARATIRRLLPPDRKSILHVVERLPHSAVGSAESGVSLAPKCRLLCAHVSAVVRPCIDIGVVGGGADHDPILRPALHRYSARDHRRCHFAALAVVGKLLHVNRLQWLSGNA